MVFRTYVEKRQGLAPECEALLTDCRDFLGVQGLRAARIWNRYDVEGIEAPLFENACRSVFSEPPLDLVSDAADTQDACAVFAVEPLPGQFDQRADSASQCIQLLSQGERPRIRTAKVYALYGMLTDADVEAVKRYVINPVESREASLAKPETLAEELAEPKCVSSVEGFTAMDEAGLSALLSSMGLAMDIADLKALQDYFRETEHRDPTVTELRVVDTYWSDHCRHTTFSTHLDEIRIDDDAVKGAYARYLAAREEVYGAERAAKRPQTLMDIATIGTKTLKARGLLPELDESEEINACSIQVPVTIDGETQQWLVQFKNETHNHPTEIEPFGGAATCLGGAIRDPLSGRAYVYQAMRVTGSGDPRTSFEDTMPGKLPSRKITTGAASGYSSYGNQIGLATGQVTELYDPGYMAKRMEIGAVIGASPKENVIRETPMPGDAIVLLGGRTGRDGCGGATGSSKAHTEQSIETCGAEVQKGNPPTERKIQRLFRDGEVAKLIKRCNDFGAGGVCVAIGELADGLTVDLDRVSKKYEGLDGTELAISESQERMAVVLDPKDVPAFLQAAHQENLEAQQVAEVTENPRLKMNWRGDLIVDLSREFLNTNGVTQRAKAKITAVDPAEDYRHLAPKALRDLPVGKAFEENLKRLEVCSQKGLSERFDSSIGAGTVLMPFSGKYQLTPEEAMVAKIPLLKGETDDATAMSYGYIPGISRWSPFHGAAYAVVESLSKLLAVGADPAAARLTFQEYFERLHDVPERWGKPAAALLGAFTAQVNMGNPAIGGKDSMSGSFEALDVPPTLVSFAVAMTKASKTVSACFRKAGSQAWMVPVPENPETHLPAWDKLKAVYAKIYEMMGKNQILSASVVREGGAAAAVCRMCFGNQMGFQFAGDPDQKTLFAPLSGSLVLELKDDSDTTGLETLGASVLGAVCGEPVILIGSERLSLAALTEAWEKPLEKVFPTRAETKAYFCQVPLYSERNQKAPAVQYAKPRVFIPAFPGTNCEVDTARAFERAGAKADVLIVKNLTPADIEETIEAMVKAIQNAQIIMLPGGFSGGDEPDGSGKFIATTFRNPRVAEAVSELLEKRDGLMLGICNGFQALIKLGLVPYGRITQIQENDPTLTFNTLGRHVSRMVYTRVTSVKSPWLMGAEAGQIHTVPVSHGEGRFVADAQTVARLMANGQIATQYVDLDGNPSMDIQWNPNGSVCAIEGITSPDGRILGKMGHSERQGENLYGNVPGEKDQQLFASGVRYFK